MKIEKTITKCIIIVFFCFLSNVYAGIGIDPIQVEVQVGQGEELKGVCKIFNTGEKVLYVSARLEDWFRQGIEPASWVKINPVEFKIEPGKSSEVEYTLSIPRGSTGELMAMVFFCGVEEGSNISAEFSVPIYAAVKGTEIVDAEIIELDVNYNKDSGIDGYLKIKNKGNVHIRPYTTIQVINSAGKAVSYFSVQYGLPVQVNKERKFSFSKSGVILEPGRYEVIAESNFGQVYGKGIKVKKEAELIVKIQEREDEKAE